MTSKPSRPFVDVFVTDVHGDAEALDNSLLRTELFTKRNGILKMTRSDIRLTLGGDMIDRWNENVAVLERISQLQHELRENLFSIPGNHEVVMDWATLTGDPEAVWLWMRAGGHQFLRELCEDQPLSFTLQEPSVKFPVSLRGVEDKRRQEIQDGWSEMLWSHDLLRCDMPAAFAEAKKKREQYQHIFHPPALMQRHDDLLIVHARIDDRWADILAKEGVDGANKTFRDIRDQDIRQISLGSGDFSAPICGRQKDDPKFLQPSVASVLWDLGIRVYLHGHEARKNAEPSWEEVSNVWILNGDLSMSRGMSHMRNGAGAIVVGQDGAIRGYNSWREFDLGHLYTTRRRRPKGR